MSKQFILDRPLYTDKDKKLVLEEGDKRAAFLIGGKGTPIEDADVEKYNLNDSHRQKEEEKKGEARVLTTADIEVSSPVEEGAAAVASHVENDNKSESSDLESLTVAELKDKAKDMGLSGYSTLNKADLIAAIEAGPQEEEE